MALLIFSYLIPIPRSPIPDPQSPIPNPRSPIPDPQSPIPTLYFGLTCSTVLILPSSPTVQTS
ncbi:hypothetical protein BLD44_022905 [Mastigocladus laminosus UU774]|nr:hypothetical protein BLD44_022905 [Mastigocladus laminosus UU774]